MRSSAPPRPFRFARPFGAFAFLALILGPASAQDGVLGEGPVLIWEYPAPTSGAAAAHDHPPVSPLGAYGRTGAAAATFEVTYTDFPPNAEAAFQTAVDLWAQFIESDVPITIEATWAPLGTNVLGSAGPLVVRDFNRAPVSGTWYPLALANALAGRDLAPDKPDITATFSSTFERWYFGTDGLPPSDQVDLVTIVLHEIGHGLGFIGSFDVNGNEGVYGLPSERDDPHPFIYDRFARDAQGRSLLNPSVYPFGGPELAAVLQEDAFLGGPLATLAHGTPVRLHIPQTWSDGTSYSHLDETTFPRGTEGALMTPFINNGEVLRSPGAVVCGAFADFGWSLAPACEDLLPDEMPNPLPDGFALTVAGWNPFRTATTLDLRVETGQNVEVRVFDAAGRRLRTETGFADAGVPFLIPIEGGDLPSGVYFVQVVGQTFTTTQAVTRIR